MSIPFMDLYAYNSEVEDAVFSELKNLVKNSEFIGGHYVTEFEKRFSEFTKATYTVGFSNGTEAIYLALKALGLKSGDEVITVANTFIASASPAIQLGINVKLVDCDENSLLMNLDQLEVAITKNTKAIIAVHLYGHPLDLDRLVKICNDRKIFLIQDAAQAHGALWNNKPICEFGNLQTYSFYPGKNLGAWGDAGAATTKNSEIAKTLKQLSNHGRAPNKKYEHDLLGTNGRLDPLQAMILTKKLELLEKKTSQRRKLFSQYKEALTGISEITLVEPLKNSHASHHLLVIKTNKRDELQNYLKTKGIQAQIHYPVPVHLQPSLKSLGYKKGDFPMTEKAASQILSLPFYPEMPVEFVNTVSQEIKNFFKG